MSDDFAVVDVPEDLLDQVAFEAGEGTDEQLVEFARWAVANDPLGPEGGHDESQTVFVTLSNLGITVTTDLLEAAQTYTLLAHVINPDGRNVEVFLNPDGSTHVVHSLDEVFELADKFGITAAAFGSPDLAA